MDIKNLYETLIQIHGQLKQLSRVPDPQMDLLYKQAADNPHLAQALQQMNYQPRFDPQKYPPSLEQNLLKWIQIAEQLHSKVAGMDESLFQEFQSVMDKIQNLGTNGEMKMAGSDLNQSTNIDR